MKLIVGFLNLIFFTMISSYAFAAVDTDAHTPQNINELRYFPFLTCTGANLPSSGNADSYEEFKIVMKWNTPEASQVDAGIMSRMKIASDTDIPDGANRPPLAFETVPVMGYKLTVNPAPDSDNTMPLSLSLTYLIPELSVQVSERIDFSTGTLNGVLRQKFEYFDKPARQPTETISQVRCRRPW